MQEHMASKNIKVLPWPPKSPDMNIVDIRWSLPRIKNFKRPPVERQNNACFDQSPKEPKKVDTILV